MYILKERVVFSTEFYLGKTYIYQGDCYPGVTTNRDEAKKYTTKVIAENACKKLNVKTGRNFEVIEI
jgi:hypothetical protein